MMTTTSVPQSFYLAPGHGGQTQRKRLSNYPLLFWTKALQKRVLKVVTPVLLHVKHAADTRMKKGLFGVHQRREEASRLRRERRLLLRDRPPPATFPASLLTIPERLLSAISPPGGGGISSGPTSWNKERIARGDAIAKVERRSNRGERAMKGLEVGEKTISKFAQRLKKTRTGSERESAVASLSTDADSFPPATNRLTTQHPLRPLTPSALFTVPPSGDAQLVSSPGVPTDEIRLTPLLHSPPPVVDNTSPATTSKVRPIRITPLQLIASPSPFRLSPGLSLPSTSKGQIDYFSLPNISISSQDCSEESVGRLDPSDFSSVHSKLGQVLPQVSGSQSTSVPCVSPTSSTVSFSHHAVQYFTTAYASTVEFFIGDSRSDRAGGVLGFLSFLVGFIFFILYHTAALAHATVHTIHFLALFIFWVYINLSGRTDLSQLASRYFSLIRKEWESVSRDDGERLSLWTTVVGLAKIAMIHAMTRERYLRDGPGKLVRIDVNAGKVDCTTFTERVARSKPVLSARRRSSKRFNEPETIIITSEVDSSIAEGTLVYPHLVDTSDKWPERPPRLDALASTSSALLPLPSPLFLDPQAGGTRQDMASGGQEEPEWLEALRRHCRFATASYGLHSYIVAPPTPLFTPSGQTLPRSIFRHLAKLKDKSSVLHVAIQEEHDGVWGSTPSSPYLPTFYLIRDHVSFSPFKIAINVP
jgi:hypothetical protein